jgi:histidine triad (HIT) family protein
MDCIFCKIVTKEIPAGIFYENDAVIAFVDIRPSAPGHVLIVPKQHSDNTLSASAHALDGTIAAVKKVVPAVLVATGATGWNLIANNGAAAGQVVLHTHWHIIPRHADDGLRHWPAIPVTPDELAKMVTNIKKALAL